MKLTRRHKIYIAVLGLVLAAAMLADDPSEKESTSLRTKKSAKARTVKTSNKKKHSKQSAASLVETHLPPACDFLAERLKEVCGAKGIEMTDAKEAFGSMDAWFSDSRVTTAEKSHSEIVRTFTEKYRLKSVLLSPGRGTVIINDKCLSVGEQLDGFKLVSVISQAAILESGTVRVILEMDAPETPP